jgi:hypothetical protein
MYDFSSPLIWDEEIGPTVAQLSAGAGSHQLIITRSLNDRSLKSDAISKHATFELIGLSASSTMFPSTKI